MKSEWQSETELRVIDTLATFSPDALLEFLRTLGAEGRVYFQNYLICESAVVVLASFLFAFTVSFVATALSLAETDLDERIRKVHDSNPSFGGPIERKQSLLTSVKPALLNLIPFAVCFIDLVENATLLYINRVFSSLQPFSQQSHPASVLVSVVGSITKAKWVGMRIGAIVAGVTLVTGWSRVLIFRYTSGLPLFGLPHEVTAKVTNKPTGLSRPGDISQETWKQNSLTKRKKARKT